MTEGRGGMGRRNEGAETGKGEKWTRDGRGEEVRGKESRPREEKRGEVGVKHGHEHFQNFIFWNFTRNQL